MQQQSIAHCVLLHTWANDGYACQDWQPLSPATAHVQVNTKSYAVSYMQLF